MALTLDLPPQLEQELREQAAKAGLSVQEEIAVLLRRALADTNDLAGSSTSATETVNGLLADALPEMRVSLELVPPRNGAPTRPSALGKYAHVPGSSDEFAREKRSEIDLEGRRAR
jgi:hypothetical protein